MVPHLRSQNTGIPYPEGLPNPISTKRRKSPNSGEEAASNSDLQKEARHRIDEYTPADRGPNEDCLKETLHAFVKYLPRKGSLSVSRDICGCLSDSDLYEVFTNLRDGVLFPSKLNSIYKLWKIPDYQSSQWGPPGIGTFLHVCTRGANHKHPH